MSKCSIHDMDADAIQLDLEIDSMTPVTILHVESTNEFYVHHCDNTKKFVSNQNRINALLKSSAPLVDHSYALGDYVFVHSSDDWYRGLITQIRRRSTAGNDDDDDDDLIYQVYCVDFGHRENDVTRHQLRPIQFISHALPSQQHQSEEASSIITLPFQAVRRLALDRVKRLVEHRVDYLYSRVNILLYVLIVFRCWWLEMFASYL